MKNLIFLLSSIFTFSSQLKAQEICFVSADFQEAEHFIVFWERPNNAALYDSVFIYRRLPLSESVFTKVGAVPMNVGPSYFKDSSSITYIKSEYKISFLYLNGTETTQSDFHRPVIMDYNNETLSWSMYVKENQTNDLWMFNYRCLRDELGMGVFSEMGSWTPSGGTGTYSWTDPVAATNQNMLYQMEMDMPTCNVSGNKANINTSRSNIKQQFSNAVAGIENKENIIQVFPNPASSNVKIQLDNAMIGKTYSLVDQNGKVVLHGIVLESNFELNLSKLSIGNYFFNVFDNENVLTTKIVKN